MTTEIEEIFNEEQLNYDIYQIKYNIDDKNNHICIYDNKEKKNSKKLKKNSLKDNDNDNDNLIDIIENILIKIYELKMNVVYLPDKNKFKTLKYKENGGGNNESRSKCIVF